MPKMLPDTPGGSFAIQVIVLVILGALDRGLQRKPCFSELV